MYYGGCYCCWQINRDHICLLSFITLAIFRSPSLSRSLACSLAHSGVPTPFAPTQKNTQFYQQNRSVCICDTCNASTIAVCPCSVKLFQCAHTNTDPNNVAQQSLHMSTIQFNGVQPKNLSMPGIHDSATHKNTTGMLAGQKWKCGHRSPKQKYKHKEPWCLFWLIRRQIGCHCAV